MNHHTPQLDLFGQPVQPPPAEPRPSAADDARRAAAYARWIAEGQPWPLPDYMDGVLSAALGACLRDGPERKRWR